MGESPGIRHPLNAVSELAGESDSDVESATPLSFDSPSLSDASQSLGDRSFPISSSNPLIPLVGGLPPVRASTPSSTKSAGASEINKSQAQTERAELAKPQLTKPTASECSSLQRLVSVGSGDADAIAHSLFSFSYSYDTAEVVTSRLSSMLRSLEKIKAATQSLKETAPSSLASLSGPPSASGSVIDLAALAKNSETAEMFREAKQGLHEKNRVEEYIDAIRDALHIPVPLSGSQQPGSQRISMPIVTARKESASWLESVARLLEDSPRGTPSIGKLSPKSPARASSESEQEEILKGIEDEKLRLLEILSMPYFELSQNQESTTASVPAKKPSLLRRASSFVSLPIFEGKRQHLEQAAPSQPTCDPTPMFHLPAKQSARNAVFTTGVKDPYKIFNLNDMACLMFGTTLSDARNRPMTDFVSPGLGANLSDLVLARLSSSSPIVLSGEIYDIVKEGNIHGVASIWVERSSQVLVWVVEEINLNLDKFSANADGSMSPFPVDSAPVAQLSRIDDLGLKLLDLPEHLLHYTALPIAGRICPVLASFQRQSLGSEEVSVVTLRELRTVATSVVVNRDFQITSYNEAAIYNLLGFDRRSDLRGKHIEELIPEFNAHRKAIDGICNIVWSPGVVIPEHMFRQVTCENTGEYFQAHPFNGVKVRTVSGQELFVDLQLRIVSADDCVLWISYSRPAVNNGKNSCIVPSQLELLNVPKRRHLTASTNSSDSEPSTPQIERNHDLESPSRLSLSSPRAGPIVVNPGKVASSHHISKFTQLLEKKHIEVGARRRELTLRDFEILRTLGEGAYGRVVLAKSKLDLDLPVIALKSIIKDRILVDTWTRDRKLGTIPNEIKIMNQLLKSPHPNIISLVDFFEDEANYHVEMERHGDPGVDLFDYIEENPGMTELEAKKIFFQVVSAVAHLHRLGIVHRDIKDENIVMDEDQIVKLIDFGSAAYAKNGPFDVFVGTVDYAAPEVLRGQPFEGPAQDVWALGILLYTILYKETPFYSVDEILDASLRIPHDVSVDSTNLIHKILAQDFKDRPTAQDIVDHEWFDDVRETNL